MNIQRINLIFNQSLLAVCTLFGVSMANVVQVLTNGDFEAGSLAGWTVTDLGFGIFFTNPNDGITLTPLSGVGGSLAFNPAGGLFFATSDQHGPGTHALTQTFTITPGAMVSLSFDMFMNDYSGVNPTVDPIGLEHTVPVPN